jgi:hypothetical protein
MIISSGAFAQLAIDENFNYTVGDSIGAHGWVSNTGGATNRLVVTSPGLTFPGYPLSGIGNATYLNATGQDEYKNLTQDSIKTGSVYASVMVKFDTAKTGDYFFALIQSGSTTFYEGRLQARNIGAGLQFGITKGNSSTDTSVAGIWTTGTYSYGVTYLLVMKYTFVPGGTTNDQVSLYVFDTSLPATEPAVPTVGPITYLSADASAIGRVALRQGTFSKGSALALDGIRVATSWFNTAISMKVAIQGLFNGTIMNRVDTVLVNVRNSTSPYAIVGTTYAAVDPATLTSNFVVSNALNGSYYLEVIYRRMVSARNGIRTFSSGLQPISIYNAGSYNFTNAAASAYGSNQVQNGLLFATYNGDINQDETIDGGDLSVVDNAAINGDGGYINTDVNGDDFSDGGDLALVDNNATIGVSVITP